MADLNGMPDFVLKEVRQEMAVFDELPDDVRLAVRESILQWNAHNLLHLLRDRRVPSWWLANFIREQEPRP